jgi:hypothetical protein
MRRIAVVGAGAAAFGVLHALQSAREALDITLIAPLKRNAGPFQTRTTPRQWDRKYWRDFYAHLRASYGRSLIPPKTNFGSRPPRQTVDGWGQVWRADALGGLTEIWGLSCMPYDAADLEGWPIGADDLAPHYAAIAHAVGLAQTFEGAGVSEYANRPAPAMAPLGRKLAQEWGSPNFRRSTADYVCAPGPAFLALETRAGHPRSCNACGECMIGCTQGSMFNAADPIEECIRAGFVRRTVDSRVLAVRPQNGSIICENADVSAQPFDAIFVCAGTFGSAEIALRSIDGLSRIEITDSAVWTFPAFARTPVNGHIEQSIGLTSAVATLTPKRADVGPKAQIQVYPLFDHIWRQFTPQLFWPAASAGFRRLARRMLIARLFADGTASQRYAVSLSTGGDLRIALAAAQPRLKDHPALVAAVRHVFSQAGFWIPSRALVAQTTSSHYIGGLPLGKTIGPNGALTPTIYFCDALTFPRAPATSPTFTVMANAHRVASLWLAATATGETRFS